MKVSIIDRKKGIEIRGKKMSLNELLHYVDTTSADEESNVTLFKDVEEKHTVKFNWVAKNKWKVDYPIRLNNIHKQRYVSLKQCLQVIETIYNSKDIDRLKGFMDVPTRHFTLDDMLAFKKEDEMMLRGQDPDTNNTVANSAKKTEPVKNKSLPKKTAPKPLQQLESSMPKANVANKGESILKTVIEKKSKPTGDNSFFSI